MGPGKEGAAGGPGFVALACQAGFHSTSIHNTGPRGGREVGQTGLTIPRRVYLSLSLTQERGETEKNGRGKEKKTKEKKRKKKRKTQSIHSLRNAFLSLRKIRTF